MRVRLEKQQQDPVADRETTMQAFILALLQRQPVRRGGNAG
jgi:hypothetical protein